VAHRLVPGRRAVGGDDVVDAPVHERARAADPADEQPAFKFPQRRPGDGPAHREARGDLMLAGDARTWSASREVVDERVDDLGVLAFAHITTMTRQVVQTTRHPSTDLQAKVNIRASCRSAVPDRTSRRVLVTIEQSFPYSDECWGTMRVS